MPRKTESEEQRQAKAREARERGESASEAGATQGASQQKDHETRGGHRRKPQKR